MRILTFLFVLFCVGLRVKAQSWVHVKGTIKNFKQKPDTVKYISSSVLDLATFTDIEKTFPIHSDGSFSFSILLQRPQYIEFTYLKLRFDAFARPGSNIYIRFDDDKIDESLTFSADNALLNNEMQRYHLAFEPFRRQQHAAYITQYEKVKDSPQLYKKLAYETLALNQKFLAGYINSNKPSPAFRRHVSTDLKYSTAYELMMYGSNHSVISDSFYSFLKDFPPDNASAAYSGVYLWFINAYVQHLYRNTASVDEYLSYLQKETKGFLLDVLFSWQLYEFLEANFMEGAQQYLPAYKKAVKNKIIKKQIFALYNKKQREFAHVFLSKNAHLNPTPENVGQRLFQAIIEKYKGKVVYIDFWGTWCAPCIEEMPNAKKLREALKDKEVVFLYMAVQSPEPVWKQVIAKLDIQGEHYLLKDEEYLQLRSVFQIEGVPHYVLVDKEGTIREKNALRPGDPELEEQIQQLLK